MSPLRDALAEAEQDDYEQLPEAIKQTMTRTEYLWLSDLDKAHLIQQECDPEW